MRNVAIAQHALDQIRKLNRSHRLRAAQAIDELRQGQSLSVWMLPSQSSHQFYAVQVHDLILVFRELAENQTTVVLSIVVATKKKAG